MAKDLARQDLERMFQNLGGSNRSSLKKAHAILKLLQESPWLATRKFTAHAYSLGGSKTVVPFFHLLDFISAKHIDPQAACEFLETIYQVYPGVLEYCEDQTLENSVSKLLKWKSIAMLKILWFLCEKLPRIAGLHSSRNCWDHTPIHGVLYDCSTGNYREDEIPEMISIICVMIQQNPTVCDPDLLNLALAVNSTSDDLMNVIGENWSITPTECTIGCSGVNAIVNLRDAKIIVENIQPKVKEMIYAGNTGFGDKESFLHVAESLTATKPRVLQYMHLGVPVHFLYDDPSVIIALQNTLTGCTLEEVTFERREGAMPPNNVRGSMETRILEAVAAGLWERKKELRRFNLARFLVTPGAMSSGVMSTLLSSKKGAKRISLAGINAPRLYRYLDAEEEREPGSTTEYAPLLGLCLKISFDQSCLGSFVVFDWGSKIQLFAQLLKGVASAPRLRYIHVDCNHSFRPTDLTKEVACLLEKSTALRGLEIGLQFQVDLAAVFKYLAHNSTLQVLELPGGQHCEPKNFVATFLETSNNTTLEFVNVSMGRLIERRSWTAPMLRLEDNMSYYCALNRYGRGLARDHRTPTSKLIRCLFRVQRTFAHDETSILYGLLRENPSIWVTSVLVNRKRIVRCNPGVNLRGKRLKRVSEK